MSVEGPCVTQCDPYPAFRKWVIGECVYGNTLNLYFCVLSF